MKQVPDTPGDLLVKSKLSPRSGSIVCIGVSTHPEKNHPLFLVKLPPLNQQIVQASTLAISPLYIDFSYPPPLKVEFFSEPSQY